MPTTPDHVDPTFVLIPGAGGDAWYWHRTVAELRARGVDALAVDLPAADDRAGLATYAEHVVSAVGDRRPLVLVAQSMGGFTAPLVCGQVPVERIVLVNAMIPLPGETGGAWWSATGQAEARAAFAAEQGRTIDDGIDVHVDFLHDLPDDVLAEALRRGSPEQSERPFADPFPLAAWPDVPTTVIAGRDDRFFPAAFQQRVAEERLGIAPEILAGGHLLALSHPVELVNRLLVGSMPG